ncbi:MAG: riboflavin kinase [bacterium]
MIPDTIFHSKIIHGNKLGRTIGFPTLNLTKVDFDFKPGVYAVRVTLSGQIYPGVLYLGPRYILGETKTICEIHLLAQISEVYGENIAFRLVGFIRAPKDFANFQELQQQISTDIIQAKKLLA